MTSPVTVAARWAVVVVALVGAADAWWIREWDLVVLFAAVAVAALALLGAGRGSRRAATLRPDLAGWVADRARRTGERPDDLVDRAVAAYRHDLEPDRTSAPSVADVAS